MHRLLLILICVMLTTGAGYVGKLPNITSQFEYKTKKPAKSYAPHDVSDTDADLKPIPRDNKSYIDIIIKKDKTVQYVNDVNDIVLILQKLKTCIENNQDIQKFNAITSNLIDHIALMETTYAGMPESKYISFRSLMSLSTHARDVAILKTESQVYNKYLPYSGSGAIYTPANVEKHMNSLLNLVNENLYILKNLD